MKRVVCSALPDSQSFERRMDSKIGAIKMKKNGILGLNLIMVLGLSFIRLRVTWIGYVCGQGSRLRFKSAELAEFGGSKFVELFGMII